MFDKKIIQVPSGIKYISDWFGFQLPEENHIMNKQLTGCGFTEYCINSNYPVVLCSPRKHLLENKANQHIGDVLYVRNNLEEDINVDMDLNIVRRKKTKNKTVDPLVIRQNVINLIDEVKNWIRHCRDINIVPKILVTYDSFRLVKSALEELNILHEFYIIVDEFQSIFTDSRFKSETELDFVNELRLLPKRICFVSATPMLDRYLKKLDMFSGLPYYEMDWAVNDITRITKPEIKSIATKSVVYEAGKIIDSYLSGDFKRVTSLNPLTKEPIVIESREAVLYFNSIKSILYLISKYNLKPDQVCLLVANTDENRKNIKRSIGNQWEINKIPLRHEPRKMFTFCTRTVYMGVDFYSDNARSFVFSDANIDTLSVDISLDLPQIIGRQRLDTNPWANSVELYYTSLHGIRAMPREEFDRIISNKVEKTKLLIKVYGKEDIETKQALLDTYRTEAKYGYYKQNYLSINTYSGSMPVPVFNNLVMVAEERAFDIQQEDYKDRFVVQNKLAECGPFKESILSTETSTSESFDKVKKLLYELNKRVGYSDKMKFICEYGLDENEVKLVAQNLPMKYKNHLLILGIDKIKALGYNVTRSNDYIAQVVSKAVVRGSSVYEFFEEGNKYTKKYIKEKLKEVYINLGIENPIAKSNEILDYFEAEEVQITINGSKCWGYKLIKRKY